MTTPVSIQVFRMSRHERIAAIRRLVPANHIDALAERMAISKVALCTILGVPPGSRRASGRVHTSLSIGESERLLGVEFLIGQVQSMVEESGRLDGFDAAVWLGAWMQRPLPALNGELPAAYMDSSEGQRLLSQLLAMTQTGAYA